MPLVLREQQGTPLTYAQLDGNFTYLSQSISQSVSGTIGKIPLFISGNAIGSSLLSQAGSVITLTGSMAIQGSLTAESYILSSSVIYITESFSSGSTVFGNSLDDFHDFTGSVSITGSFEVNGPSAFYGAVTADNITGSLFGSASYALSGSYVLSSSVAVSASYAPDTTFPYTGSAIISGSLTVTGSLIVTGSSTFINIGQFQNTGSIGFSYLSSSVGPGVWSSGGSLSTARYALAGAGTQNEALAFGGGSPYGSCTEEYNGTAWSSGGAMIVARRRLAGAGTQNAGLAFGGGTPSLVSCTEEYGGTSWSTGGAMAKIKADLAGAGTQNAGLSVGGYTNSPTYQFLSDTEEYDGSSWTSGGALSVARYKFAAAGTQNAGLAFGGYVNYVAASCTEEYNGTSWSTGGALIFSRTMLAGAGTQNAGLAFGGLNWPASPSTNGRVTCTEEYNGTSWSVGGALSLARYRLAGAGTQTAGLAFGGFDNNYNIVAATEEYSSVLTYNPKKSLDYSVTTGFLTATGSLFGSASFAISSSLTVSSSFAVSSSLTVSASFAVSSSRTVTSSFAVSSSNAISSSFAITGSNAISSSFAISSSNAISSSFAISSSNAVSSSFALSSSFSLNTQALNGVTSSGYVTNVNDSFVGTPRIINIISLTAAEYSGIGSPSSDTLYIIIPEV